MNTLKNTLCYLVVCFAQVVCCVDLPNLKVIRVGSALHDPHDREGGRFGADIQERLEKYKAALVGAGLTPENVLHISDACAETHEPTWYKNLES
ncbi:MAG: hypothetical protein LBB21_00065 [Holosporaceae bacterium]|jgi:hypothetical protein|nr:hypothetical protein [Holosporaceae bacterium]